jgi:hypothetical protein
MRLQSRESIREKIEAIGINVMDIEACTDDDDCIATPYVLCSHETYPGIEPHLYTAADAALWTPCLTSSGDVLLFNPHDVVRRDEMTAWTSLISMIHKVSRLMKSYVLDIEGGHGFGGSWFQQEDEWFRGFIEGPYHGVRNVSNFIDYVDPSIRRHIHLFNRLGFATTESCSGIPSEHPDRTPYPPYVMFDERAYPGISAHLYTLANATGWIPSPGRHHFDITLRLKNHLDAETKWDDLYVTTKQLGSLLDHYIKQICAPDSGLFQWRRGPSSFPTDIFNIVRGAKGTTKKARSMVT